MGQGARPGPARRRPARRAGKGRDDAGVPRRLHSLCGSRRPSADEQRVLPQGVAVGACNRGPHDQGQVEPGVVRAVERVHAAGQGDAIRQPGLGRARLQRRPLRGQGLRGRRAAGADGAARPRVRARAVGRRPRRRAGERRGLLDAGDRPHRPHLRVPAGPAPVAGRPPAPLRRQEGPLRERAVAGHGRRDPGRPAVADPRGRSQG